jgi:putative phage-type endonuclease
MSILDYIDDIHEFLNEFSKEDLVNDRNEIFNQFFIMIKEMGIKLKKRQSKKEFNTILDNFINVLSLKEAPQEELKELPKEVLQKTNKKYQIKTSKENTPELKKEFNEFKEIAYKELEYEDLPEDMEIDVYKIKVGHTYYLLDLERNDVYSLESKRIGKFSKEIAGDEFIYEIRIEEKFMSDILKDKVKKVEELPQPEQRSTEWYKMRNERLTASDGAASIGENPYQNRKKTILGKCGHNKFTGNSATRWGQKYEEVACQVYEKRMNYHVDEYGLIPHGVIPFIGASPDGITPEGIMLEIKCPPKREIKEEPPHYYWIQMQLQLEVCDLEICDFEQCKLEEYYDEDEYLEDNYFGDYSKNEYGNEKGVIYEAKNIMDKSSFYIYPPLDIEYKKTEKWAKKN